MSYLILAAFVYGVKVVIDSFADHYEIDLIDLYEYRNKCGHQRPMWQKTILRPLFYCNVCMSSIWGTVGYLLIGFESWQQWALHLVICAALVDTFNWIRNYGD